MTNTDTLTALRTRAMLAIRPEAPIGVVVHDDHLALVAVTLPDGTTGMARATDVLSAQICADRGDDGGLAHLQVQQGKRVDLWHVSQLA